MPRPKPVSTEFMDVAEFSRRTGMHRDTIKKGIRLGTLPGSHPTDGVYLISREWYERWKRGEWTPESKSDSEEAA